MRGFPPKPGLRPTRRKARAPTARSDTPVAREAALEVPVAGDETRPSVAVNPSTNALAATRSAAVKRVDVERIGPLA